MKLKAIIIDNESRARENLRMLIDTYCKDIVIIGDIDKKGNTFELIKELNPELVFLNIGIPYKREDIQIMDELKLQNNFIVFITENSENLIRTFEINALDYLVEPIEIDKLVQLEEKLKKTLSHKKNQGQYIDSINNFEETSIQNNKPIRRITINHPQGFKIINVNHIVHLRECGNFTEIVFENGTKYLDARNIKVYQDMLEHNAFLSIHKSHFINLKFVKGYDNNNGDYCILNNGDRLPLDKKRVNTFLNTAINIR